MPANPEQTAMTYRSCADPEVEIRLSWRGCWEQLVMSVTGSAMAAVLPGMAVWFLVF